MKLQPILIALALGASTCLLNAQPDQGQGPGSGGQRPGGRRQGGPGGPGGMQGGVHLMPPFVQDQLVLSDDQKKDIAALEKDTQAKLDKILTAEQKKKLADMRQNMGRRFGGQGGQGGPGGPGGQGGPGGPGRGQGGGQQRPPADDK